jgi:hypothetical protein
MLIFYVICYRFRVESPPKYISPAEAQRIHRRFMAAELEAERLWLIQAPMRARWAMIERIRANPNAVCKKRLDFSDPKPNDARYKDPLYRVFLSGFDHPEAPEAPQAPIALSVASPPLIAAPLATPLAPLAPVAPITITAPAVSPTPAPEVPQPQTTPAGANKPTGKAKNRPSAPPQRTTRSQTKASQAQAAKIHGLDASLILGSRLRSSKSSKKR